MEKESGGIGGNKFFKVAGWLAWKKSQVFVRSHLSHFLAVLLGILVLIREVPELMKMLEEGHTGWWEILIIIIVICTVLAALWELELFGSKLSTSPQEVRFVAAMRSLLQGLERFMYGKDREPDIDKRLKEFIKGFLEVTSYTLCGRREIAAGLMLPTEGGKEIELRGKTDGALYPEKLIIPLTDSSTEETTGPAGHSYQMSKIVYMPFKRWKLGWPFRYKERYEPSEPAEGWVPADDPLNEQFCSVLCIPVAVYQEQHRRQRFGVLNYSTKSYDPFVHRDFMMGECFSSILAVAFAAVQREASEQKKVENLTEVLTAVANDLSEEEDTKGAN